MADVRIVPSATLARWDVKHILAMRWMRPPSQMARFGKVTQRRVELNTIGARYGSVHFDGHISRRAETVVIKGSTYLARPQDVVFSRIDISNGAIGVLPDSFGPLAFTNEYPIFDVLDIGRLLPDYVRLLCRTKVFRSQVHAMTVGHSGRKRFSAELFEDMPIPVPPIAEQHGIILAYQGSMAKSARMRDDANLVLREAVTKVTEDLGLRSADTAPIKGAFIIDSHLTDRWSVFAATSAVRSINEDLVSSYDVFALGSEELARVNYGLSKSPRNRPGRHSHPYLRVANVQNGYLDLDHIKYIDIPDRDMPRYKLEVDDVLLCEANGTLANVGRPALWEGQIQDCAHQNHVLRVRTCAERLVPGYLVAYMQTAPARGHFQRRAKTTTGLYTINSTDVNELPVPVPSVDRQKEIAEVWQSARRDSGQLQTLAAEQEALALAETELRIVGNG